MTQINLNTKQALYVARKAEQHGIELDEALAGVLQVGIEKRAKEAPAPLDEMAAVHRTVRRLTERKERFTMISVDLLPELSEAIESMAAEAGRSRSVYGKYLQHEAEIAENTKRGIAAAIKKMTKSNVFDEAMRRGLI